jgi:hypothetical protein
VPINSLPVAVDKRPDPALPRASTNKPRPDAFGSEHRWYFGKHDGKTLSETPLSYLEWAAGNLELLADDFMAAIRAEIKSRKAAMPCHGGDGSMPRPLTPEEVEKAYDAVPAVPLPPGRIQEIVDHAVGRNAQSEPAQPSTPLGRICEPDDPVGWGACSPGALAPTHPGRRALPTRDGMVNKDDLLPLLIEFYANLREETDQTGKVDVGVAYNLLLKFLGVDRFKPEET